MDLSETKKNANSANSPFIFCFREVQFWIKIWQFDVIVSEIDLKNEIIGAQAMVNDATTDV